MIKRAVKSYLQTVADITCLTSGLVNHYRTGSSPKLAYDAMRRLFVKTNGRSNDLISKIISMTSGRLKLPSGGGLIPQAEISSAVSQLNSQGYYIFNTKLPKAVVDDLTSFAESEPCDYLVSDPKELNFKYSESKSTYSSQIESPKFDINPQAILDNDQVQHLLMDPSLIEIGQKFLKAKPIFDLIAMWWSQPCQGVAHSSAAQLYHFDLDRIKFLKFFFYLTDVTPETGPHCYVSGSSRRRPGSINRDGRLSDEEVGSCYAGNRQLELCGEAGTIIAVDTRGLHKGKALTSGNRLLLQFEMANSLFGQHYEPLQRKDTWNSEFKSFVNKNPAYMGILR